MERDLETPSPAEGRGRGRKPRATCVVLALGMVLGALGVCALGAGLMWLSVQRKSEPPTRLGELYRIEQRRSHAPVRPLPEANRPVDVDRMVREGLDWLARHQSSDGGWGAEDYVAQCGDEPCAHVGMHMHDVGVTGLALLAFLNHGHHAERGEHRGVVRRGVRFLANLQDEQTGRIGSPYGNAAHYNHAVATLALGDAHFFSRDEATREVLVDCVRYIQNARNPHGAWRYEYPPTGDNDTSVTGWMVAALRAAQDGGLEVQPQAFAGALQWLDEMTDPVTGRIGYDETGSVSARVDSVNDHFRRDYAEALTGVGLLARIHAGQHPEDHPSMRRQAQLICERPPALHGDQGGDLYAWFHCSLALYEIGGRWHAEWQPRLEQVAANTRRLEGCARGSWDPDGPWGYAGGRVYSTALMLLALSARE